MPSFCLQKNRRRVITKQLSSMVLMEAVPMKFCEPEC